MSSRIFKVPALLQRRIGNDVYGQPKFAAATSIKVAIVELKKGAQHTTVRTDSGGTHGRADEFTADAKLLVAPTIQVGVDDQITVDGVKVKVRSAEVRRTALARVDHIEIIGTIA